MWCRDVPFDYKSKKMPRHWFIKGLIFVRTAVVPPFTATLDGDMRIFASPPIIQEAAKII